MKYKEKSMNVYAMVVVFTVSILLCFYMLYSHIEKSHRVWVAYAEQEMDKAEHLNQAVRFFGYGGFIHNFKNAVIRKDRQYLEKSSQQIDFGIRSLNEYLVSSPKHHKEIRALISAFFSYREKLPLVYTLIDENASIEEIDKAVYVDDKEAVDALTLILSDYNERSASIIKKTQLEHGELQEILFLIVFLLLVISLVFMAIFVYYEKKLTVKLRNLELVFNYAPSAIITADSDGFIVSANNEAMKLFGFSKQEMYRINVDDLVPLSSKSKHQDMRKSFQASAATRVTSQKNNSFKGKKLNGEEFPVRVSVASGLVDGEKNHVVVVHDLSDD